MKGLTLIHFTTRSSPSQMFLKIGAFKNFANFTGKHLCWSFVLLKFQTLRPATLLKSNYNTGISCAICGIFKNTLSYRTVPVAASVHKA